MLGLLVLHMVDHDSYKVMISKLFVSLADFGGGWAVHFSVGNSPGNHKLAS